MEINNAGQKHAVLLHLIESDASKYLKTFESKDDSMKTALENKCKVTCDKSCQKCGKLWHFEVVCRSISRDKSAK